ncbi:MAG: hypothetical protein J6A01_04960 [Proteobacteria bacterium]|nr:hypothetical protein [Pseudomonadota bacterium]
MTCPSGKKKDTTVIRNENSQTYLNTGVMYMPKYWHKTSYAKGVSSLSAPGASYFDAEKFNGITIDD